MDHTPFDVIAFSLLALLGVVALSFPARVAIDHWTRRREGNDESRLDVKAKATSEASAAREPSAAPALRAKQEPTSGERGTSRPARPASVNRNESPLRRSLQELLNRGVALEQNVSAPFSVVSPLLPTPTKPEDVDAWEADVEAALRDRPRDRSLFRYERPTSPLASLSVITAFDNPLKRRLKQRTHQLETIIKRLP